MVVKVETDVGLVGWAPGEGSEKAHQAIINVIAPFLEGRNLVDNDALRVQFMAGPGADPARGPGLVRTYCSVEIALLDLLGKAHGVPVSELIGGRMRDRIRLYGSAGMYMESERLRTRGGGHRRAGFPRLQNASGARTRGRSAKP